MVASVAMAEFAATTRPRSAGGGRHPRHLSGGLFGGARVCLVVLAVVGSVLAVAPVAAAQGQRFPDVAADHYAFEAVEWAVEAGVTVGYTDGTFKPQRPLIRRHALVFMERYYDEILGADESEDFTRGDMMVLLKAINDGTLRGETPQDAASGTGGAAQGQRFPDVAADHYAFEAVEWAVEAGVTTGYTDGTFKPGRALIRRHALVFMERYYDEILGADESEDFTRGDMMVLLKAINDGTIRTRPPGAGSATADIEPAISISDTHGCKLSADGRLTCWGDNTHGQATPPPGTYTDIAVSTDYSCAIRTDGQLACWGADADDFGRRQRPRTSPPAGEFTDVTANYSHPCGLRADGAIVCWGASPFAYPGGGSTDRPPSGTFTDISLGYHVGCGVRTDQSIQCWGNVYPPSTTGIGPSPQGTFTAVDVTSPSLHSRACALRTDDTITCWPSEAENDAPAGSFTAISVGGIDDSCALRTDLTITCWGRQDTVTLPLRPGQQQPTTIARLTDAPSGRYLALALTDYALTNHHACALRDDNTHTCWGGPTPGDSVTVEDDQNDANGQQVIDFLKANIIDRYGSEHPWLEEVWDYANSSEFSFKMEPLSWIVGGSPSRSRATRNPASTTGSPATEYVQWCVDWDLEDGGATSRGLPVPAGLYRFACAFVVPNTTLLSANYEQRFVRDLAHIYVESTHLPRDPTPIALTQIHFQTHRSFWNNQADCYPIGLIVDIMVQLVLPAETMEWWPNCTTVPDQPDNESITTVKQALTGQIPETLNVEFSLANGTLDYSRVWACAVYYHCERLTAQYIAPRNLIYQLGDAFGGYCSSEHVNHLIKFELELAISQPWKDGNCGDPSPTATPGFSTASNLASRRYKSAVDRYSTQHPWLATAWNQTNRPDYTYIPVLSPYGSIDCAVSGECASPGRWIVGEVGGYPGITSYRSPPASEPLILDANEVAELDHTVVHELTHDMTLHPYDIHQAPSIAIGMLYFRSLQSTLEPDMARTTWCAASELYAQAATALVFPEKYVNNAFPACFLLNSHSQEAVSVARDTLNGVIPNWFYTQFGTNDGGIDYVQLWESIKGPETLALQLQHAFGGYCVDIDSVRLAASYKGIELPDNARQPWVDGGCPQERADLPDDRPASVTLAVGSSANGQPGCSSEHCRHLSIALDARMGYYDVECWWGGSHEPWFSGQWHWPASPLWAEGGCWHGHPGGESVWVVVDGVKSNEVTWGQTESVAAQFTAVAVGFATSCGISTDQSIECWGRHTSAQDNFNVPPSGAFSAVSFGSFGCGIRIDRTVECWGYDTSGETAAPAGEFNAVSAGYNHACAIRSDSTVECWGNDDVGQSTAPSGTFSAVSAGDDLSCGIRTNRSITCWGSNGSGQANAPAGQFTVVSTGWGYSCGIRTDRAIVCWGSQHRGGEPPDGAFIAVSVPSTGGSHLCAIRVNSTITCWGANQYQQASPPGGQYTAVRLGWFHTCALRTDGTIECWGVDWNGRTNVPSKP